jgi:hypothetical protein
MGEYDLGAGHCIECDETYRDSLPEGDIRWITRPFIVCPTCGNKRCPKATRHDLDCTGSNEPGQPGSAYPMGPHLRAHLDNLES